MVLGDLNVDLHGITNMRLDWIQGTIGGQDDWRAATISTLSSHGLEDGKMVPSMMENRNLDMESGKVRITGQIHL